MQLNTETTFLKKHLFFMPDLLILIIFLILGFYKHVIYDRSFIAYYSIIFLFVIFSILSVYMKLYCWRKLPLSVSSFILFSINCLQLLLYIMVIKVLLDPDTTGLNEPIYLSNISITSQYRYLILTAISLFVIVGLIIAQIFSYDILSPVFPSLREEIYKILYTWNDGCIVDTCNKLTDLLYSSFWFRISFTITHFSIFHLTRLFGAYLLVQCAFFQGDFRIFVYLVPIMLVRWLLSFFDYYFFTFLKASENYIRSLVTVTLANKGPAVFGFIKIDSTSQVSFTLTDNALLKGYTDSHISNLAQEWYIEVELASYFNVYFRFVKYLYYFILLLRVSCWYYITQMFFFPLLKEYVLSVNLGIFLCPIGKIVLNKKLISILRNFHNKNSLYFVILFINFSFFLSIYTTYSNSQSFSSIFYLVSFFCMCLYLTYIPLYYWRNLETSLFSFISYFIALTQVLFLFLIYFIIYPSEPIYIKDLSYLTAYRYIFIGCSGIIFAMIVFYKKKKIINPINHYAEIQKIAYSWNNYSVLGKFSLFMLKKLIFSKIYRKFYFIFDIFLNIIPKLILLYVTINFALFSGDLRELFVLAPYFFIISCLSHIQYYIEYIIEGNCNVIRELLTVNILPNTNQALLFSLTTEAKKEGFTVEQHLPMLSQKWIELSNLSLFFNYKKTLKIISLLLSITQILCWIVISIYFLYFINIDAIFAAFPWQKVMSIAKSPWTMSKQYFSSSRPLLAPPRDCGYLYEKYQNQVKLLSNGEFGVGHPIVGELLSTGTYRVDGYLTHGTIPSSNVLYNIIPNSIDPASKNQGPQNFVAFTTPVYINPFWIGKQIQGSQAILENSTIKPILESFLKSIQR